MSIHEQSNANERDHGIAHFAIIIFSALIIIGLLALLYVFAANKMSSKQEDSLNNSTQSLEINSHLLTENPLSPTDYAQTHPEELASYFAQQVSRVEAKNMPDLIFASGHSLVFSDSPEHIYLDQHDWEKIFEITQRPEIRRVEISPDFANTASLTLIPSFSGSSHSDSVSQQQAQSFLDAAGQIAAPVGVSDMQVEISYTLDDWVNSKGQKLPVIIEGPLKTAPEIYAATETIAASQTDFIEPEKITASAESSNPLRPGETPSYSIGIEAYSYGLTPPLPEDNNKQIAEMKATKLADQPRKDKFPTLAQAVGKSSPSLAELRLETTLPGSMARYSDGEVEYTYY